MGDSIARRWRELSGQRNWEDLLEPLHPDLRRYIIHYGQMAGAVGDLFNSHTRRPNASVEDFFAQACVRGNPYRYKVTRFIYAGSQSVETAWIGYVAVATDRGKRALGRRDILIAWRGTATTSEWCNNLRVTQRATTSESDLFPGMANAKIHRGFHSLYTGTRPDNRSSAREQENNNRFLVALAIYIYMQVRVEVEQLVNKYKDEEISITVTGFSLGAALATLTAMDMVIHGYNKTPKGKPFMVTAFTFGGPRVGNPGLGRVFDTLGLENLRLLRIKNTKDFIPDIPPNSLRYANVGKELIVDTSVSNYLNQRPMVFNSSAEREDGYQILLWVYYGLSVFMYLNELWLPLLGLILILIWDYKINRGMGGDKYQTLCWVCFEASMYMVYERLLLPLLILMGILHLAENNRRDGYEYQTWRWVCYGLSVFMVHKSYWIPLLGPILYFIWGERIIRKDRDVGEDMGEYDNDMSFQDIGEDQDGCDLITISEDEDEDEDEDENENENGNRVVYDYGGAMFRDVYSCHNMDVYLHGVAIKDIDENTLVGQLDHDIALVNKHSSRLKDEHGFPPYWWAGENRQGMVQSKNGRWRWDV
ncbi:hypothetical protein GQ457_15G029300 [Hibiscus cannabinus]